MTRPPWHRGARGEWYVVAQFALFALVAFGPRTIVGRAFWPFPHSGAAFAAGLALGLAGAALVLAAALMHGSRLTPLPHPGERATLHERGVYAWMRHPIYTGALLTAFGVAAMRESGVVLAVAFVIALLLDRKAAREERWLLERFPGYAAYRARVRKFVPLVY